MVGDLHSLSIEHQESPEFEPKYSRTTAQVDKEMDTQHYYEKLGSGSCLLYCIRAYQPALAFISIAELYVLHYLVLFPLLLDSVDDSLSFHSM